jgi:hypothetical protein
MKQCEYEIPTPTPEINSNSRIGEALIVSKEPVMTREEFYDWISQHIEFHTEAYKAVEELGYSGEPYNFRVIQPRAFENPEYECGCCSSVIPKRRPVFSLAVEAFGQDGLYLCPSCFPKLVEECSKSREQLRKEAEG